MSGRGPAGSDEPTPAPTRMPVPDVPDDVAELGQRMPEILRLILNRIAVLENDLYVTYSSRFESAATQISNIQQAQTAVQQSLNLLQAAHNTIHDQIASGARGMGDGGRGKTY